MSLMLLVRMAINGVMMENRRESPARNAARFPFSSEIFGLFVAFLTDAVMSVVAWVIFPSMTAVSFAERAASSIGLDGGGR